MLDYDIHPKALCKMLRRGISEIEVDEVMRLSDDRRREAFSTLVSRSGVTMYISYNQELDVLEIELASKPARYSGTMQILPDVEIDIGADGAPLAIEISNASRKYPRAELAQFEQSSVWLSLREAAESIGFSPDTLRVQVNNGRLAAKKKGNTWLTTVQWLEDYLASRRYNAKAIRRA
jgi:uncharacterized protein YuzE